MNRNWTIKKGIAIGMIFLFFGVGVAPSISIEWDTDTSQTKSRRFSQIELERQEEK